MEITVVLADDHRVVRSGLRLLLNAEEGIEVVAEADDVESALRAVLGHKPNVLVLDLNMPGEPTKPNVLILDLNMPGEPTSLDAIPMFNEHSPDTKIVILTMQEDPEYARKALQAGVLGYVLKEAADVELVKAVRWAAEGEGYITPSLGAYLATGPAKAAANPDGITNREVDVLKLIAKGHTNAEIADMLFLSIRTVETHRAHLQRKSGCSSRAELVTYARENDLS